MTTTRKTFGSVNRRLVLKGFGGATLALPFLEAFTPRKARAQGIPADTYAIFFRQANGCQQAYDTEPERFFPRDFGALTDVSMADRALDELSAFRQKLLVLRNVNLQEFDFGDGHAWGAMQALTARPAYVPGVGGSSEAGGESIDHRIGVELNTDGRESLVLYAGQPGGWLNGSCISYRDANVRRSSINDPYTAYQTIVGGDTGLSAQAQERLRLRQLSVNDLVREQLQTLIARPELSSTDRQRLDLHLSSVRDLEVQLGCRMAADDEAALQGDAAGFDSSDGDETLQTARLHMDVAALAVSCGHTRAVSIQVGCGNDGFTRYRNLATGELMENYHYLSHRQLSHGNDGAPIPDADLLHHYVDRQFAQTFRHLLERLDALPGVDGDSLLNRGVSVWFNDAATGPPHSIHNVPWVLAGNCAGFLRQGEMIALQNGDDVKTHRRLLNTLGSAVGLRNQNGDLLDDFGDPSLPGGVLPEIMA